MTHTLILVSRKTGLSLTELKEWTPREFATIVTMLDDEARAEKRANK